MVSFSIYELKLQYLFDNHNKAPLLNEDFLLLDSGRSALCFILDSLKVNNDNLDVYVNAYTTDVVHTTIRSLGLNLIPYDINPYSFEAEVDIRDASPNTVFIQTGLFGFQSFKEDIYKKVNNTGGFFLEDCCNSFQTQINGREAGTIGDAAIFSFRVGKALSSGGGALRVKNPIFKDLIKDKYEQLQEVNALTSQLKKIRISLDYLVFEPFILNNISRPLRKLQKAFPILNSIVKGGVVDTEFEVDPSKIHKMGKSQIRLALNRLASFNKELRIKKRVSDTLSEKLKIYPLHIYANDLKNYQGWNYLFYPILLNKGDPDSFVNHMRTNGFDATRFHNEAVKKSFPYLKRDEFPGTFTLIDKLVVIPNTTRMLGNEQKLEQTVDRYFQSYT